MCRAMCITYRSPTRRLTSLGNRGREYKTCSHRAIHTLCPALGRPERSFILGLVEMGYAAWVGGEQEEERTTFAEWIRGGHTYIELHTYVLRNGAGVMFWGFCIVPKIFDIFILL